MVRAYDVLGFGALNLDRLGRVDQVKTDHETVVDGDMTSAGGSAANSIAALAKLKLKTGFIGVVGSDSESKILIKAFLEDQVDTHFLKNIPGRSGIAMGLVDSQGSRSLFIFPGVNSRLDDSSLPSPDLFKTRFLHLSSFVDVKQLEIQKKFTTQIPTSVLISMAPGMIYCKLGLEKLKLLLKRSFVVFLNQEELEMLTGQTKRIGAQTLLETGVMVVVVTDRGGAYFKTKSDEGYVPTVSGKVVDTTGAGDAFVGGVLYGMITNQDLPTAVYYGNVLAHFCLQKFGARSGLPDKDTFAQFIDHKKGTLPMKRQRVLIIGSGGREHAIGWKLCQSPNAAKIYFATGNAGTRDIGENVDIKPADISALLTFAKKENIDITIVGPEAPLALGIVDRFQKENLKIFGPTQKAARLETSKAWAVEFLQENNLPHPKSKIFKDVTNAYVYIKEVSGNCVIKADGLALGKGVYVCNRLDQAEAALEDIMVKKIFGSAGNRVVIQEKLVGREVSVMAFCDGKVAVPIIAAQDHKRAYDRDKGPNTGGMGAFAPAQVPVSTLKKMQRILSLVVKRMVELGMPYVGILYGGFMISGNETYVLEFNCRFGDPETQVQLPLLESDLLTIFEACINGRLTPEMVSFADTQALCVVLASDGYPGHYETGKEIKGLEKVSKTNGVMVFHAGTKSNKGKVLSDGGRVLGVTATDKTQETSFKKAYQEISKIYFEGMHYRKDIGKRARQIAA